MVGSVNTSSLSQIYRTQGNDYSALVSKIASGKEINRPSDDFAGFTRASGVQTKISSYKELNKNLTELREPTQMASDTGNAMLEDLSKMKNLASGYATALAANDTAKKA